MCRSTQFGFCLEAQELGKWTTVKEVAGPTRNTIPELPSGGKDVVILREILELVHDRLNDETFTRQQLVFENDQSVFHVFENRRDRQRADCRLQLQSPCEELLKERLGEITAVADQLPPQFVGHLWDRFTITDAGGREVNCRQVTLVFDNQMGSEAIEPPHAALAALGYPGKASVATDAPIMADSERLSTVFTPVQAPNPADAEQPRSTPSPSRR